MQKLIIKNKYQSQNRMNILTAAGIAQINEPITPQNGERIFGGLGVVTFNQASQYNEEENPNDPITPPNCPNCGGGIEPEPVPSGNCEKKNISELKQILEDYANQSFCDKEFPDVQFSTFIGYDSAGKEIELRMLCPSDDDCGDDSDYDDYCYPEQNPFRLRWTKLYLNSSGILDYDVQIENLYTNLESAIAQYNAKKAEVFAEFSSLIAAAISGSGCDPTTTTEELGCGEFVNCCERVGKKLYFTPYRSQCNYGYVSVCNWVDYDQCPGYSNTNQASVELTTYLISSNNSPCHNCC